MKTFEPLVLLITGKYLNLATTVIWTDYKSFSDSLLDPLSVASRDPMFVLPALSVSHQ